MLNQLLKKRLLTLMIVVSILSSFTGVQAQSGGGPTPPPDGMVYQGGVLTDHPLPREEAPALPVTPPEAIPEGWVSGGPPPDGSQPPVSEEPVILSRLAVPGEEQPPEPADLEALLAEAQEPEEAALGGGDPCRPSHMVTINFDEKPQPAFFSATKALRSEYRAQGITFWGDSTMWLPATTDGGAVLDGTTFAITGESAPNFLAFNTAVTMSGGGVPRPPQLMGIMGQASYVEMKAASPEGYGAGSTLNVNAFNARGFLIDSTGITLSGTMQTVAISHTGITFIQLITSAPVMAVDDISYLPESIAQVINFDEKAQPLGFAGTNPLRSDYAKRGVTFAGAAPLDGGAILNEGSNFVVSGYSAPNFLAFNSGSHMANGGDPRPPEEIRFNMPVSLVQVYPASGLSAGLPLGITAYDWYGNTVMSASIGLKPEIQMLTVMGKHITRVVIDSPAQAFIVDDLIYRPENAVHVDFDDSLTEPVGFIDAMPLRDEMISCGVSYRGGTSLNGGAILNSSTFASFSLYSPPNILAFNSALQLENGGIPMLPEYLIFNPPADYVEFYAGGFAGNTLQAYAYSAGGAVIASDTISTGGAVKPVRLTASQPIRLVAISSASPVVVIDDLFYTQNKAGIFLTSLSR